MGSGQGPGESAVVPADTNGPQGLVHTVLSQAACPRLYRCWGETRPCPAALGLQSAGCKLSLFWEPEDSRAPLALTDSQAGAASSSA